MKGGEGWGGGHKGRVEEKKAGQKRCQFTQIFIKSGINRMSGFYTESRRVTADSG